MQALLVVNPRAEKMEGEADVAALEMHLRAAALNVQLLLTSDPEAVP
jgi:hypothetical protein